MMAPYSRKLYVIFGCDFNPGVEEHYYSWHYLSQKFMPTSPRPSKPWRVRLDAVCMSGHRYANLWLKISSKERKCPCKAEEEIY